MIAIMVILMCADRLYRPALERLRLWWGARRLERGQTPP
jgi:hypothetical protein